MKKYLAVMKANWKRHMEYRFDMLIQNIQAVFALLIMFWFWKTIFGDKKEINGYSFNQLITYYFLMRVMFNRVALYGADKLAKEIKKGEITRYLVKPMDYTKKFVVEYFTSANTWAIGNAVCILLMSTFLLNVLVLSKNWWCMAGFIVIFLLNGVLASVINLIVGIVGFWITEVTHLKLIGSQIISLLSGGLIPIIFFPDWGQKIINWLPFKYLVSFPIEVYLGKIGLMEWGRGVIVLILWTVGLYWLAKYCFKKGLRGYESFN